MGALRNFVDRTARIAVALRALLNGNIAVPFSSSLFTTAQGLLFPAVQNPSADIHCLDDYEEGVDGSWTPTNTTGLTIYQASYTKKGEEVTIHFDVQWPATVDAGNATITGIPFTAQPENFAVALGFSNYGALIYARLNAGTITFSDSAGTTLTNANLSTKEFVGTCSYRVS